MQLFDSPELSGGIKMTCCKTVINVEIFSLTILLP